MITPNEVRRIPEKNLHQKIELPLRFVSRQKRPGFFAQGGLCVQPQDRVPLCPKNDPFRYIRKAGVHLLTEQPGLKTRLPIIRVFLGNPEAQRASRVSES